MIDFVSFLVIRSAIKLVLVEESNAQEILEKYISLLPQTPDKKHTWFPFQFQFQFQTFQLLKILIKTQSLIPNIASDL